MVFLWVEIRSLQDLYTFCIFSKQSFSKISKKSSNLGRKTRRRLARPDKRKNPLMRIFSFVGAPRFELELLAPKASMLPLHHAPMFHMKQGLLYHKFTKKKGFMGQEKIVTRDYFWVLVGNRILASCVHVILFFSFSEEVCLVI